MTRLSGFVSSFLRAGVGLAFSALACCASAHDAPDFSGLLGGDDWPMFGQNIHNTAHAWFADIDDVKKLKPKWTFTAGGDISARAAVVNGRAFFPDWAGNLWAVDTKKGKAAWSHQLSDYGLPAGTVSRTSPAVADGVVYIGTQGGAWLLAIDAGSGKLLWKTQLESPAADPNAMITASPAIVGDLLITGVASNGEFLAAAPGVAFTCCSGRGSVVAVTLKGPAKGKILWQTFTVPPGYSGGGVWSSNVAVDLERLTVYAGTGNNYSRTTAPAFLACMAKAGATESACTSPDNHVDSILALNLLTGKIRWAKKFVTWNQPGVTDGSDDWNVGCLTGSDNCPSSAGPDYDFASAPNLIHYFDKRGRLKTIVGAGQKSGIYYALDPDTGAELWRNQVGPGSSLGGMEWGSATDGKRIYVSIANLYGIPTAVGGAGSWSALDPETGAVIWQVGNPSGALSLGPLTVADGLVFVPSMAGDLTAPSMLALSAATGQTLWTFSAGSSVVAGASIADGVVYWGSGYAHLGIPGMTGNNKFYAFSKNGK